LQTLEAVCWLLGGPDGAIAKLGLKHATLLYNMSKLELVRPIQGAGQGLQLNYSTTLSSDSSLL
jgi:hypothetical protein